MRRLLGLALALVLGCGDDSVGAGGSGGAGGSAGAGGSGGSAGNGDTYLPWEGGPDYYRGFSHGPPSDPAFFPISVWLQSPSNADAYKAIGVNTFIGLYNGPTDQQLSTLQAAGVPALCDQAMAWSSHLTDPTIIGWTQQDEPDNAQPDGNGGYGPCVATSTIVSLYQMFRANDATRPVFLNFGQGAAYADYIGRGSACAGMTQMYAQYALGADIVSFDIYPVNNTDTTTHGNLWYVAMGVDQLRMSTNYQKPVWNWIETTGIDDPAHAPTPAQVESEVWMSLVHGSRGIGYFCHIFSPTFVEAGLLANATMKNAVGVIDQQIHDLAPVLNTQSLANGGQVASSNTAVPIDTMWKRSGGALYVFAVAMRPGATHATFTLREGGAGTVTVIGEARTLTLTGGAFSDDFAADFAVHRYRIGP